MNDPTTAATDMQYITDAQGNRVAVVLNFQTYQYLTQRQTDTNLFIDLSQDELEALAHSKLSASEQNRLDELLTRSAVDRLSMQEQTELDHRLEQIDHLNVLKTRARYTLHQQPKPFTAK